MRERKKEWKRSSGNGVDGEWRGASGNGGGELGMWVVWDFRFFIFIFLTVRYVSNLGGSRLKLCALDFKFWIGFGFGIGLD